MANVAPNSETGHSAVEAARVPPCGCSGVCDPALAELVSPHLAFGETLLWVGPADPESARETWFKVAVRLVIVLITVPLMSALAFREDWRIGPALGATLAVVLLLLPRRMRVAVLAIILVVLGAILFANSRGEPIWETREVLFAGATLMIIALLLELAAGQFRRLAARLCAITNRRFIVVQWHEDLGMAAVFGRPGDPKNWHEDVESFRPEQVTHFSTKPGAGDSGALEFMGWLGSGKLEPRRFEGIADLSTAEAIARWLLKNPSTAEEHEKDPLRLEICPSCGYSLSGLPLEAICPECGEKYDQSQIIIYGWGTRPTNCRGIYLVWWGVVCAALCAGLILFQKPAWLGLACAAACAGVLVMRIAQRWEVPFPGLLQIRLSSLGCYQEDVSEVSAAFWICWTVAIAVNGLAFLVNLTPILAGSATIRDLLQYVPGLLNAAAGPHALVISLAAIALIGWSFGTRSTMGHSAGENRWRPWNNIVDVKIEKVDAQYYTMSLRVPNAEGSEAASYAVKATIRCSDAQASALRARIERWRAEARVGDEP